jgi:hypothetical protein
MQKAALLFREQEATTMLLMHGSVLPVEEALNLNSVNQLISVMVTCGVLFEVRTGFLNII